MRKSHCVASLLAAVALTGGLNSPIQAQVVGIGPFVPGPLAPVATPVDITFDSNINPPSANPFLPSFSQDAQNIIQAHQLARKQVQAAINYLISHRRQILAGEDKLYNDTFGDFYDPNSPFAGQYDRTITIDIFDQNGNVVGQQTVINTAHFDLVLNTFLTMLNAMAQPTLYSYGGPQFDPLFSTYAAMDPVIGEPLFGGPTPTSTGFDRGFREWGNSNSLSPAHLAQLQNNPGMALKWIDDNADVFALDPATGQVLIDPATGLPIKIDSLSNAFFKEKLGAYSEPNVDPITGLPLGTNTIFVGGGVLEPNDARRRIAGWLADVRAHSHGIAAVPDDYPGVRPTSRRGAGLDGTLRAEPLLHAGVRLGKLCHVRRPGGWWSRRWRPASPLREKCGIQRRFPPCDPRYGRPLKAPFSPCE
jgi:hypothetical protein